MKQRKNQQNKRSRQIQMRDPFEDFFKMKERMLSNFGFDMRDPFEDDDFFNRRRL